LNAQFILKVALHKDLLMQEITNETAKHSKTASSLVRNETYVFVD
jgi:hypothetical protein